MKFRSTIRVRVHATAEALAIRDRLFAMARAGTPFDIDAETQRYIDALAYEIV